MTVGFREYVLGNYELGVESKFNSGTVYNREDLLALQNKTILSELKDWEIAHEKQFNYYVVDSLSESDFLKKFSHEGLVSEFSKIKNIEDINTFAHKYGLLGLAHPASKSPLLSDNTEYNSLDDFYKNIVFSKHGFSEVMIEPIEIWFYNVSTVRKLMRLYNTLKKYKAGLIAELDSDLIKFIPWDNNCESVSYYNIYWYDDENTHCYFSSEEIEALDTEQIYREILINNTLRRIQNNIEIEPIIIESDKKPLGFYVDEIQKTKKLHNAIYYDLWKMLNEDINIDICANKECRLPFFKFKRQEYCSNSCKQQAYRTRQKEKDII